MLQRHPIKWPWWNWYPFFILSLRSVAMPSAHLQPTSSSVIPQSFWSGSNPIWATSNTCRWYCLWCMCVFVWKYAHRCMYRNHTSIFYCLGKLIMMTHLWRWRETLTCVSYTTCLVLMCVSACANMCVSVSVCVRVHDDACVAVQRHSCVRLDRFFCC